MQDEREKRLKALSDIAKGSAPQEELKEPHVSEDTSYFDKLRSDKDRRRKKSNKNAQTSFLEMLDKKEEVEEETSEGLSDEQKEQIAADTLARKRREMGISNN